MSDPTASRTSACLIRSVALPAADAPRRRSRTVARRGAALGAAAALTAATLGLGAPTGAAATPLVTAQPTTTRAPAVATHGWSPTGAMITPRLSAASALLSDGRVLVTGGYDSGYQPLSSSELYDPTTGTWTATGSLLRPLVDATAITVGVGTSCCWPVAPRRLSGSTPPRAPGPRGPACPARSPGSWPAASPTEGSS